MTTLLRRAAVLLATATAAAGLALPASATAPTATAGQAAAPLSCPGVVGVCALNVAGVFRIITSGEPYLAPPVVAAVNQTPEPWCFFSAPGFNGDRREVAPQESVEDFGFHVQSARPGPCTWS
ncbi:hypothetical protein [Nonomuraea guangzhouensis]|uniref:Secreted protein n=1 Tax=Nonomuraea guangzhouensis TaxID=1291555 RepID=A0ABW4GSH8_9ACTN|nr:hypothetical protein [Nonomuraea guangzhouensis]